MSPHILNFFKYLTLGTLSLLFFNNLSAQNSSDEYITMARAAGARGNFAKAADYCEKALKKSPLDMDIKEYLGKCYLELGQLEKARFTLVEVLRESPRRVDARHYLINLEMKQKRYYSAVCYTNELLEITPYSKGLWLKKVQLYTLMHNYTEANRSAKRLYQIFPNEKEVKILYNNTLKEEALKLSRSKNMLSSIEQYERILEISPTDLEAYVNLINAYTKTGNFSTAISVADRGLQSFPQHQTLLDKKVGLLDEMQEYQKAISVIEDRLRKGESAHYKTMLNYMVERAAKFYKNADPYALYARIYEQNPRNKDAFDYILSTSLSRGYFTQADELVKKALKLDPKNKNILVKQLFIYEAQKDWDKAGNVVEKLNTLYPNDSDIKEKYVNWIYQKAKIDFNEQNYKSALWGFLKISKTPQYKKYATQYVFAIQNIQKTYLEALKTINSLIADYPTESEYILNKIDLLTSMGSHEEAYTLAKNQLSERGDSPEFKHMYMATSLSFIKNLNQNEEFEHVKLITKEILTLDPQNTEAYNYGIGARVAMKQYNEAIEFIQTNPLAIETKDIKLKLAGVYSEANQHEQATSLLKELHQQYPFNDSLKNQLVDEMLRHAKSLDDSSKFENSKTIYTEIRRIDTKNTSASIKLTNILIEEGDLAKSMQIIDSTLVLNKEYPDLLFQKSVIYEKMGDYSLAREYHAKFLKPSQKPEEHKERLSFLESKEHKNEFIVSYLNTTSDSTILDNSIATVEYLSAIGKKNKLVLRGNYTGRKTGTSVQGEVDWYHDFENKSSFLASVGIANTYFAKFKSSFSYFLPITKSWQTEIGARYYKLQDRKNFLTGIIGLEKTFSNVWLNGKVLLSKEKKQLYNSIFAQSRFYIKNNRNYISAMAFVGTVPEDQRINFQVNTFSDYVNTMVGAGYYHYLNAKTAFGVQGNWYNYKVAQHSFVNQYNLFITVKTSF